MEILPRMPASGSTFGMSMHLPSTSYFQPWWMQRRPHSSLRPKNRFERRCAHQGSIKPTRPLLSRKAISSSPITLTRIGGLSGTGISRDSATGSQ